MQYFANSHLSSFCCFVAVMLLSNFLIFPDGSLGGCAVLNKDDNTFSGPKYAKHACQYFTRRHKATV